MYQSHSHVIAGYNSHVSWKIHLNCKAQLAIVDSLYCDRIHQVSCRFKITPGTTFSYFCPDL